MVEETGQKGKLGDSETEKGEEGGGGGGGGGGGLGGWSRGTWPKPNPKALKRHHSQPPVSVSGHLDRQSHPVQLTL